MNFLLWACRVLHMFGVVILLGGLMFQNAVVHPIEESEGEAARLATRKMLQRFVGFLWMSIWIIGFAGIILMMFDPRFIWFRFDDRWSILLGFKQVVFILMVFYAYGYARMLRYLLSPASNGGFDEKAILYGKRLHQFRTISIFLGIVGLLLSAGMVVAK